MNPTVVLVCMGVILLIMTWAYCSTLWDVAHITGAHTQVSQVTVNDKIGYWTMDADLNWCEYNYHYTRYIAEPINTITASPYLLLSFVAYRWIYKPLQQTLLNKCDDLLVLIWIVCLMGVATAVFHSTLAYSMQVFDEFTMYILAITASIVLYTRDCNHYLRNGQWSVWLYGILMVTGVIYLFCPRYGLIHDTSKVIFSVSFPLAFLYTFMGGVHTANECNSAIVNGYYKRAIVLFIVSMVAWLLDTFACDWLRNLPIPYLHLHSWWHIGTALALFYLYLVIVSHRLLSNGIAVKHSKILSILHIVTPDIKSS